MFKNKPKIEELNVKYREYPVKEIVFKDKKGFTREEIEDYVNKMKKEYIRIGHNGDIQVVLWYPDEQQYFSNPFTDVNKEMQLFSFEKNYDVDGLDPDRYTKVLIRVTKVPGFEGKSDLNNDCLYNCLLELVPDLKKIWVNGFYFKKFLGLKREDGVDIKKISLVEEELKDYKINVNGDHQYISTKKAKYELFLLLVNEHYTIDKSKMWETFGISNKEKEPLVYKFSKKDFSKVFIFGRTQETNWKTDICVWDFEHFQEEKKHFLYGNYCFIELKENINIDCKSEYEYAQLIRNKMKEKYIEFVENAKKLKEITNDRINLYKTGGDLRIWSLELFRQMTPNIQPEEIKDDEAEWLEEAKCGPLIWGKNGYKGKGYKYDMISMYGSIMRHQNFSVPIRRGEFKKITKEEFEKMDYYSFGIYRVKIYKSDYRVFRKNKNNKYTHYDLTTAKKRGYKMELIEDDKPNFLFYDKNTRVNGNKIFREFVGFLFPLKQKGIKYSKEILNNLWGALIQKNTIKLYSNKKQKKELVIKDSRKLHDIKTLPNGNLLVKLVPYSKHYLSNFARIGPFILAFARKMIGDIIDPFLEDVVRLNTDGWISKNPCNFNNKGKSISCVKEGNDIGNVRTEGSCEYIEIIHCNNIVNKEGISVLGKNEKIYWV